MADTQISFGDLYEYNTSKGIIIPQTDDVKEKVEFALKQIFGDGFSTQPESVNGRLVEALTLLFTDVCGINALNITGFNVEQAVGVLLDNLGANWGVVRLDGESDAAYRKRVIEGFARGSGYVQAIRNAIGAVAGVKSFAVLENGSTNPAMRPISSTESPLPHAISVAPSSIAVFVDGGANEDIASAIAKTKPCGCNYTFHRDYGIPIRQAVYSGYGSGENRSSEVVVFYRQAPRYCQVSVTVSGASYKGDDITADTIADVMAILKDNLTNTTVSKSEIMAAIASSGKGIVATGIELKVHDGSDDMTTGTTVSELVIPAFKRLVPTESLILVTVE